MRKNLKHIKTIDAERVYCIAMNMHEYFKHFI